jgi:hypothetical protein
LAIQEIELITNRIMSSRVANVVVSGANKGKSPRVHAPTSPAIPLASCHAAAAWAAAIQKTYQLNPIGVGSA